MTHKLRKTHLLSTIAAAAAIALIPSGVAAQTAQTAQPTTTTTTTTTQTPAPTTTTITTEPTTAAPATTTAPTEETTPATSEPTTAPPATTAPDTSTSTTTSSTTSTSTVRHHATAAPVRRAAAAAPVHAARAVTTHHAAAAAPPAPPAPAAAAPAPPTPIAAAPAPIAPVPTTATNNGQIADWVIPAVAIAVILIALIFAGWALTRRRRRRLDEAMWYDETPVAESEPEMAPGIAEPTSAEDLVEPPEADWQPELVTPAPASAAVVHEAEQPAETTLPSGFDLSRFGPHVQAAYRGPTEDNPSLSLRHRLHRAAALDQMERRKPEAQPEGAENAGFMFPAGSAEREESAREYEDH